MAGQSEPQHKDRGLSRRKRYTIYLTTDEHACLETEAKRRGTTVGGYVRDSMLLLSGFSVYSGPMFAPGTKYVDRSALFVTHDLLRLCLHLSRFVREVLETRDPQVQASQATMSLLIKMLKLVRGYPLLSQLKMAEGAWELAYRTMHCGKAIAEHHPMVGNEVYEDANAILQVLAPDELRQAHKLKKVKS